MARGFHPVPEARFLSTRMARFFIGKVLGVRRKVLP
jgi:hypothetical protein